MTGTYYKKVVSSNGLTGGTGKRWTLFSAFALSFGLDVARAGPQVCSGFREETHANNSLSTANQFAFNRDP
jgi:hypothetical protein